MKIVFLDIDGVLNSSKNYSEWSRARQENNVPHSDSYAYNELLFDKDNVAMLNQITASHPDIKIVVSSSWRNHYNGKNKNPSFDELITLLKKVGVQAEIIGKTPNHLSTRMSQRTSRGTEIQTWLVESAIKGDEITSFVILDDDDDMDDLCVNHVWTDDKVGLVAEDVREALLVLEGGGYVPARHRNRVP